MAAQALKVDNKLKVNTPTKASEKKSTRGRAIRKLSFDMIRENAKGGPVAKFLFKYFQRSEHSNSEIAEALNYDNHSNMSMVRTGAARLPMKKAPLLADFLEIEERYDFGLLVAENNHPESVSAMKELGVIVSKRERELLDVINKHVPAGDFKQFSKNLTRALENGELL